LYRGPLYPADGDSTTVFFNQLAQNLFIGLAYLYRDLALTDEGRTFLEENNLNIEWSMCGLLNLSAGFDLSIPPSEEEEEEQKITGLDDTFEYLEHLELISKATKEKLNSYFTIDSQNTKSGVMSSFNAPLMIYRNQPITTATATSDFDLRDLRKKKMTIFIGITPDKLAIARPILNIFFSQLLSVNTKELPQKNPELKYTCLLLLDEFTSIGNMPILKKGVSYIAGFHLRILMIFQGLFICAGYYDCIFSIFIFNESAIGGNMSDATCNYSSNQYKAFKTNKIAPAPVCKGAGAD
jgi:type IV secretion system protein VirD4